MKHNIPNSETEWKKTLTAEQYTVTRLRGTERPFSGKYCKFFEKGIYRCVCCGNELFSSDTKFDFGCGWPSFWAPISKEKIQTAVDTTDEMVRTEVMCSNCKAHLGHVFEEGPEPTGLRYCINSVSLEFVADRK